MSKRENNDRNPEKIRRKPDDTQLPMCLHEQNGKHPAADVFATLHWPDGVYLILVKENE